MRLTDLLIWRFLKRAQGPLVPFICPTAISLQSANRFKKQANMKLTRLIILLSLVAPHLAQAAFLDGGWGARPIGMGGAFTAVADDTNAPLFNPAGLTQVQGHEFTAMYARLFSGLTLYSGDDTSKLGQSYIAYGMKPTRFGSFGVSWANFTTTHLYREDTVILTWAKPLSEQFSFGINGKYLRRSLSLDARTANDPVFAGGSSAAGMAVDAGILYKPQNNVLEGLRVGLAGKNLNQPDVGFKETDRVPTEWRLGLAYQQNQMPWFVPVFDLSHRNRQMGYYGGAESWLFGNTLGLRAGANRDEASAGISYYQSVKKNFGFRLDYGFTVPFFVEDTNGSHRFQVTLYF